MTNGTKAAVVAGQPVPTAVTVDMEQRATVKWPTQSVTAAPSSGAGLDQKQAFFAWLSSRKAALGGRRVVVAVRDAAVAAAQAKAATLGDAAVLTLNF